MKRVYAWVGALLLIAAPAWCADQNKEKAAPKPAAPPKNFTAKAPKPNGGVPKNAPRINNPGIAQRLLQMSPEERERALEKLPAAQQEQLRERLEKLDQLPQAQKEKMARQARGLDGLPPEKRRLVTQGLLAFNKLPDERIRPVRQELVRLMKMPEDQRTARLNSDEFKKKYSPDEQNILSDLSRNLPMDYLPGR